MRLGGAVGRASLKRHGAHQEMVVDAVEQALVEVEREPVAAAGEVHGGDGLEIARLVQPMA